MKTPESNKTLTRQQLQSLVAEWRAADDTIVLANGCFDLLHVGHIRYLQAAKALAPRARLVVALNSDASAQKLKGEGRPHTPQNERAEVLSALTDVDAVVIFDEPDVRALIHEIRPHIHAKGTDYTEESVPERDVVIACGGRVAIVGDPKNHSSSEILRK